MARKPQSRGKCQYCGEETAKGGMTKHLVKCENRAQAIQTADAGKKPEETIWHVRVQDAYGKDFWLDIEMRGSATLEKLDAYLRAIWLECCGHLSKFSVGGWGGREISKSQRVGEVLTDGAEAVLAGSCPFAAATPGQNPATGSTGIHVTKSAARV